MTRDLRSTLLATLLVALLGPGLTSANPTAFHETDLVALPAALEAGAVDCQVLSDTATLAAYGASRHACAMACPEVRAAEACEVRCDGLPAAADLVASCGKVEFCSQALAGCQGVCTHWRVQAGVDFPSGVAPPCRIVCSPQDASAAVGCLAVCDGAWDAVAEVCQEEGSDVPIQVQIPRKFDVTLLFPQHLPVPIVFGTIALPILPTEPTVLHLDADMTGVASDGEDVSLLVGSRADIQLALETGPVQPVEAPRLPAVQEAAVPEAAALGVGDVRAAAPGGAVRAPAGGASIALSALVPTCERGLPTVRLQWKAASVGGPYDLHRDGLLSAARTGIAQAAFDDDAVAAGETYAYQVLSRTLDGVDASDIVDVAIPREVCEGAPGDPSEPVHQDHRKVGSEGGNRVVFLDVPVEPSASYALVVNGNALFFDPFHAPARPRLVPEAPFPAIDMEAPEVELPDIPPLPSFDVVLGTLPDTPPLLTELPPAGQPYTPLQSSAPPNTPLVPSGPSSGTTGTTYSFSTRATDPNGYALYYVFCYWRPSSSDCDYRYTPWVSSGTTASTSYSWSSTGTQYVAAIAANSNGAWSSWSAWKSIGISAAGNSPPNTATNPSGPSSGTTGTTYSFSTRATDPNGDSVRYGFCYWIDSSSSCDYRYTSWVSSGTTASTSYSWSSGGTKYVSAIAQDANGVWGPWSGWTSIAISSPSNSPPSTPGAPSGPGSGTVGTTYTFSGVAYDPNSDNVRYAFCYWVASSSSCDYRYTSYVASGSWGSTTYSWSTAGTYYVSVIAQDANGAWSPNWSGWKAITISPPNNPPNMASMPYGFNTGVVGNSMSYTTSATDPNGNNVRYQFYWSDGTTTNTGWFASGATGTASHAWSSAGTYNVYAIAQDTYGAWGTWSNPRAVTISSSNAAPATPGAPDCPEPVAPGNDFVCMASTTDPNGDVIRYEFDWGDSTAHSFTPYTPNGQSNGKTHAFASEGTFDVYVRAQDSNGAYSAWSSPDSVQSTIEECDGNIQFTRTWGGNEYYRASSTPMQNGQVSYNANQYSPHDLNLTHAGWKLKWDWWPNNCPNYIQRVNSEFDMGYIAPSKVGRTSVVIQVGGQVVGGNHCGGGPDWNQQYPTLPGCTRKDMLRLYDPWFFIDSPTVQKHTGGTYSAPFDALRMYRFAEVSCQETFPIWAQDLIKWAISVKWPSPWLALGLVFVAVPDQTCTTNWSPMTSSNGAAGAGFDTQSYAFSSHKASAPDAAGGDLQLKLQDAKANSFFNLRTRGGVDYHFWAEYWQGQCTPWCGYNDQHPIDDYWTVSWDVDTWLYVQP